MSSVINLRHLAQEHSQQVWPAVSESFEVTSPATGETLARVADCGADEAQQASDAVSAAFQNWRRHTAFERSAILDRWHALVMAHREDIAQLIAAEVGKPIRQARSEIDYAASFISWNAAESLRQPGEILANTDVGRRQFVESKPVGPAYGITPWNFPAAMVTRAAAPALAAGCPIVLKPAEQSPLTALVLARLWEEAGGPRDVFMVLPCRRPQAVSAVLLGDHRIRKLAFTGSHAVGQHLYQQSAQTMKAISLELGGHAPFLVFDDADIDAAVVEAVNSKFRFGGQTCVCTNRIYVHRSIETEFKAAYIQGVSELKVGDPGDEETDIGPLIDEQGLAKVKHHVADGLSKGARIELGGRALGGLYHEPTIFSDVLGSMAMMSEETFGPVAPVASFDTDDEAIGLANNTRFGLAAYFWTRDMGRTFRLIDELEAGIIGANDGLPGGSGHTPFGGVKESGIGRSGGRWGLEAFLEPRYVSLRLSQPNS